MSKSETKIPNTNYRERFKNFEYPSPELLNPGNHTLVLIDHEGQMIFPVESISKVELRNNIEILAYYSKVYEIPTVLSTIVERAFAGPIMNEIRQFYPDAPVYDRISMNLWEDTKAREAVIAPGNKRLVMAGLWTDVCLGFTVLSALKAGYEVYIITDASGANSVEAHQISIQRMIQAGAIPITTTTYVSEILRDYGRADNASEDIGTWLHDGLVKYMNFGIGIDYADHMVPSYPTYKGFDDK